MWGHSGGREPTPKNSSNKSDHAKSCRIIETLTPYTPISWKNIEIWGRANFPQCPQMSPVVSDFQNINWITYRMPLFVTKYLTGVWLRSVPFSKLSQQKAWLQLQGRYNAITQSVSVLDSLLRFRRLLSGTMFIFDNMDEISVPWTTTSFHVLGERCHGRFAFSAETDVAPGGLQNIRKF